MTFKFTHKFSKRALMIAGASFVFLLACLLFANPYMPTYLFDEPFVVSQPAAAEIVDPTMTLSRTGQEVWTPNQMEMMTQQAAAENSIATLYIDPEPVSSAASSVAASTAATPAVSRAAAAVKSSVLNKNQLIELPVAKLSAINKDFLGKLYVEGSSIYEIVVVGSTNLTYLRADFYKKYAYYGTIFGDSRTSKTTLDRNTILMGHNTGKSKPNDHAFGKLRFFRTASYGVTHPYITFQTVHGDYNFQIFSVFVTPGTVTEANYPTHFMRMEFKDDTEYESYLKMMKSKSLYDTGVSISGSDKIITLVCCVYDYSDSRLVIMAKLVK